MLLSNLRVGMPIKYITDVDEALNRGNINVIDRGVVEDNSAEQRP